MAYREDLYKKVILDHNKNPRNYREIADATHQCDGANPLCGDEVTVALTVGDGVVTDIAFTGHGCAISKASGSMMTEAVMGKTVEEAHALFHRFHALVTGEEEGGDLGKLAVFTGVRSYPSRIKCATIAWHAMQCALAKEERVSTE